LMGVDWEKLKLLAASRLKIPDPKAVGAANGLLLTSLTACGGGRDGRGCSTSGCGADAGFEGSAGAAANEGKVTLPARRLSAGSPGAGAHSAGTPSAVFTQ
jgi:hypothetical protein